MKSDHSHPPRLAIAAGGTGGHFFPGLSVALEYQKQVGPICFIIGGRNAERYAGLARQHGIESAICPAPPLPGSVKNWPKFSTCLGLATFQAAKRLKKMSVDRVLGMGSFANAPACLAALITGRRLFLHEGNAIVGRANRLFHSRNRLLMLSLPLDKRRPSPKGKTLLTGFPIRPELAAAASGRNNPERKALRRQFNLREDLPVLLVFGGSQGAGFLNRLMENLCQIYISNPPAPPFQLIQLTGSEESAASLRNLCREAGLPAFIAPWSDHMEQAYCAADLVLSRAGAATLAELALFAKPTVLIPLPHAAEDHQSANAEVAASRQEAVHLPQNQVDAHTWSQYIIHWLTNRKTWAKYGHELGKTARPQAARNIVQAIHEF